MTPWTVFGCFRASNATINSASARKMAYFSYQTYCSLLPFNSCGCFVRNLGIADEDLSLDSGWGWFGLGDLQPNNF